MPRAPVSSQYNYIIYSMEKQFYTSENACGYNDRDAFLKMKKAVPKSFEKW